MGGRHNGFLTFNTVRGGRRGRRRDRSSSSSSSSSSGRGRTGRRIGRKLKHTPFAEELGTLFNVVSWSPDQDLGKFHSNVKNLSKRRGFGKDKGFGILG